MRPLVFCLALLGSVSIPAGAAAQAPKPVKPIELVGHAEKFYFNRNWSSYYWREDFSFQLKDESSGKTWRIISREPTPAYDWRMGTTFTGLKVDWKASPRVRVLGVTGVDRLPPTFYDFKLDDALLATAFLVFVDTGKDVWKEYYLNNWFHSWGDQANPAIHKVYANKKAPYDVYGFLNGQAAPFSKTGKDHIAKHPKAKMFHGLIRTTKDNDFGYEIELLHLVGPDKDGNGVVYYGDDSMPKLDKRKP